uniref:ATP synthase F0 subunit 8 n=1 Tax=Cacopsylla fuscicella TaxID=3050168 RepID=UPI00257D8C70|nr:ATP synthase F0 subunit 8 [Cacopsylla fuscicella]WID86679.1 ATP synthase F0 subunit 8 [Cacopsylla fuscicella]
MPQMAPLPWVFLLILTISVLLYMSTILFFSLKPFTSSLSPLHKKKFSIKW